MLRRTRQTLHGRRGDLYMTLHLLWPSSAPLEIRTPQKLVPNSESPSHIAQGVLLENSKNCKHLHKSFRNNHSVTSMTPDQNSECDTDFLGRIDSD